MRRPKQIKLDPQDLKIGMRIKFTISNRWLEVEPVNSHTWVHGVVTAIEGENVFIRVKSRHFKELGIMLASKKGLKNQLRQCR